MAVNPMLTAGANGIQTGMRGLAETAQDIAEMGVEAAADGRAASLDNPSDIAEAMVDLKLYERQVQASAKVVKTADEVLGFLLDAN